MMENHSEGRHKGAEEEKETHKMKSFSHFIYIHKIIQIFSFNVLYNLGEAIVVCSVVKHGKVSTHLTCGGIAPLTPSQVERGWMDT